MKYKKYCMCKGASTLSYKFVNSKMTARSNTSRVEVGVVPHEEQEKNVCEITNDKLQAVFHKGGRTCKT